MAKNRREKKPNPSPRKSRSWLENRAVERVSARGRITVDHEGKVYPVYPVNKRLRRFVDSRLQS